MTTSEDNRKVIAWMRLWAFNGEVPFKERNSKGYMAWPARFKMLPVTVNKIFADDVPLYADREQPSTN